MVRLFDFEPAAVSAPTGEGFRKIVCAVAGMSDQSTSSLLSSLPNELCFNDLRDAVKRSKKQEKTHMAGLQLRQCEIGFAKKCWMQGSGFG